jgi:hypothetical protein
MNDEGTDVILIPCQHCDKLIETHWGKRTAAFYPQPGVELIACWVYHSACWDKLAAEHPLPPITTPEGDDDETF